MRLQLADEWQAFSDAHAQGAPVSIRVNPAKELEPGSQKPGWSDFGRYLDERPVFTLDPLFHAGAYYVQEASSMFLEQVLKQTVDLSQPLIVLDLSAAPGGKSTHLLSLLSAKSLLISNEVIRSRCNILSENIQKWGYPNVIVSNNDPSDFTKLSGVFDVIVVDAPCSGEGLFRKSPEAMGEWSEDNVALCSARQRRILHDIWPALKQDGVLIYSTCTYNEEENEKNLLAFSKEKSLQSLKVDVDEWNGIQEIRTGEIFGYQLMPHRVRGEGFFIAAAKKKEETEMFSFKTKKVLGSPASKSMDVLRSWIKNSQEYKFVLHQDLIFAFPDRHQKMLEMALSNLRVAYAGVNLATVKHEKLVPEHALAVSTILDADTFPRYEVDREMALRYLRRETIMIPGAVKGIGLVTFQNTPVGWVNVLDNRVNNMYPQEWRIRMSQ